jgi:hypothetical protein
MELDASELRRRKKRWLIFTALFGVMLSVSIILGLGTTVWRLNQTMELVDDPSVSDAIYHKMIDRSVLRGQMGLAMGTAAFFGYMISFVMHHRVKEKIKAHRENERHLAVLKGLLEEDPNEDNGRPDLEVPKE